MIVLSWNCRGLDQPSAVPSLKDLVRNHKPDIVFLCETICLRNKVEEVSRILGFEGCFSVDWCGLSGGIALLWRRSATCEVQNYSQNFINATVKEDGDVNWRLTGFYGIANRGRRRDSWNILRELASQSTMPWCILGDFNDLLS